LIHSPTTAAPPAPHPVAIQADTDALLWVGLAFLLAVFFATLRASLLHLHTPRVLAGAGSERSRARMVGLLERVDALMTSASILRITCNLTVLMLLLSVLSSDTDAGWNGFALTLAVAVPLLLLGTETLPSAVARRWGDPFLLWVLPAFFWLQLPLQAVVVALEWSRKAILRVMRVPEEPPGARDIVEGLRGVIRESGRDSDLDETELELIENLMEFRDVDVAAVMTPRTEIHGVEVAEGLAAVVRAAAEHGHSRIPVFDGSLDNIVGYVSARDLVQILADDCLESAALREHLRPAFFVPETKRVSELLAEFRRDRQKMAVVLDEYGGTAGLVTLGDVLGEIVGDLHDEFDARAPAPFKVVEPGLAVIDAGLHVTEVNELLELDIPEEEDYETLAGFTLAELGHLPKRGESFERDDVRFEILEASDRRVIQVRVRKLQSQLGT